MKIWRFEFLWPIRWMRKVEQEARKRDFARMKDKPGAVPPPPSTETIA